MYMKLHILLFTSFREKGIRCMNTNAYIIVEMPDIRGVSDQTHFLSDIHTHTRIHIYVYVYMYIRNPKK